MTVAGGQPAQVTDYNSKMPECLSLSLSGSPFSSLVCGFSELQRFPLDVLAERHHEVVKVQLEG